MREANQQARPWQQPERACRQADPGPETVLFSGRTITSLQLAALAVLGRHPNRGRKISGAALIFEKAAD
jgi:hypothetical protein